MARAAADHLELDQVLFVPTGQTRYREPASASGKDRVAMLRLALLGNRSYRVDQRELRSDATGYTVDTLKALRAELGDAELHLLVGADQYAKLDTWHRPAQIRRLAKIAVFGRPGVRLKGDVQVIPMQPLEISASDIRARVKDRKSIGTLVPPEVASYIRDHGLYS